MASITMSQSARSPCGRPLKPRPDSHSFCCAVIRPSRRTLGKLRQRFSIPAKPLSRNLCSTSSTVTSNPAGSANLAMPNHQSATEKHQLFDFHMNSVPYEFRFLRLIALYPCCIKKNIIRIQEAEIKCLNPARPNQAVRYLLAAIMTKATREQEHLTR